MKTETPIEERPEHGSDGPYEWPCVKCGKLFRPKYIRLRPEAQGMYQKVCGTCSMGALERFLKECVDDPTKLE